MKSFVWMYFLIGLSYGLGALGAQENRELAWWEPAAIVVSVGIVWPALMALDVQDMILGRKSSSKSNI